MRTALVVAAVIRRGSRVLIARRRDGAERGGQWEFPGGKVEPGEGEPAALVREIDEELGCAVEVGPLLARHRHRYPDLEVHRILKQVIRKGTLGEPLRGQLEAELPAAQAAMHDVEFAGSKSVLQLRLTSVICCKR